ncbi:MAG TPA: FAD binding domain-containing protein [Solirubrobacter sp.]|nr:FAD binding domain-containing protein [Solirubrobacter sp.]
MKVHVPTSVDEVVGLLGEGVLVAGGTHAVPRLGPDESIVSLRRAGLSGIDENGDELRIGATTTLAEVGRRVPFLRSAIESIASPTIRNLATVGGNLFVPQPHGDLAVCLLALDARVEREGDLVTGVAFKVPERWFYTKAMRRKLNSASIVTVASDGERIALGGVAPEPVRAHAAEEALARGDVDAAAEAALEAADPFDDAYASAWYRRRVLPVHVRRALSSAV